ncbi:hypothetical protein GCM10027030_10600 [Luteococcus sediminum]
MNHHVLAATGLTKTYGPTVALGGVSIAIGARESVAVMGPSGSGKTTLLHCLAGILTPDRGEVLLQDGDTVRVDALGAERRSRLRRERFGFVFQQGCCCPSSPPWRMPRCR